MTKFVFTLFIVSIVSGCDTLKMTNEAVSTPVLEQTEKNQDDDAYYLNIAKDLYVAKQYRQAYEITQRLAEKANPEAQYLLGYLTYYGQGIEADRALGTQWIQQAADAGYRPAIEGLVMIRHGLTPDNTCEPVPANPGANSSTTEAGDDTTEINPENESILITPGGAKKIMTPVQTK